MLSLAIDAMGGDHAPKIVIEGLALACKRHPEVRFLLFGDAKVVMPLLQAHNIDPSVFEFTHTDEVITGDTKPSLALRGFKNASMRLAIQAVKDGLADGVVSAGNTGAYMALSRLILGAIQGVDRPALAGVMPTLKGGSIMLDLGANIDHTDDTLVKLAVMGEAFARAVLGRDHPRVGLLNVGSEEMKGHATIRAAHQTLVQTALLSSYIGFVEGTDITAGTVDVIVTDGFTGNVALKAAEGAVKLMSSVVREEFQRTWFSRLACLLLLQAFKRTKDRLNPSSYNGSPFLGLNGVAVKSHGGTDGHGFASAISVACNMIKGQINERIKHDLIRLADLNTNLD
ncbi:MAG: phosphate acyltransferase PlsX [Holosporales bacterium]